MDPQQNQKDQNKKPDPGKSHGEDRANNVPPNLPVVNKDAPVKPAPAPEISPKKEPAKNSLTLEQQISPISEIGHTPPPATGAPTPATATQKSTPPKKDEASEYGKTDVKPLRTYEQDVVEAKRRAGIGNGDAPKDSQKEKKGSEKKSLPPPTPLPPPPPPPKPKKEVPQKNAEMQEVLRKKAIEKELSKSGIIPTSLTKEKKPKVVTSISPIKTFRNDAAEKVKTGNLSTISIATAQSKKRIALNREKPEKQESHFFRNLLIMLVSLILVGSGSGLVYFFYQKSLDERSVTLEETIPSLIFADTTSTIDVTGVTSEILFSVLTKKPGGVSLVTSNTVQHLYLTKTILGTTRKIDAQSFLSRVSPNVPNSPIFKRLS